MAYLNKYPGGQDLVQRLMALKRQSQITGQVNPDYAPIVQASLADTRQKNYQDAMLGLQERGLTTKEKAQAAQESQFAQTLAFQKQTMEDQISAANQANVKNWIGTGAGLGLGATYLYTDPMKKYRRY